MIEALRKNLLVRFLIVGVASTVFNYSVYAFLYLVAMVDYGKSFIIGFLCGVAFSYFLNRAWTFQVKTAGHTRDVWRYFTLYATSLLIGLVCISLAIEFFAVDPLLANLGTILVTTCTNYTGLRFWVFR